MFMYRLVRSLNRKYPSFANIWFSHIPFSSPLCHEMGKDFDRVIWENGKELSKLRKQSGKSSFTYGKWMVWLYENKGKLTIVLFTAVRSVSLKERFSFHGIFTLNCDRNHTVTYNVLLHYVFPFVYTQSKGTAQGYVRKRIHLEHITSQQGSSFLWWDIQFSFD